ncbi:23S rRNA pseudouridine synthase F [Candidatus Termititenax aidoneus]|uniref:Pseudouridine synthase n=1 Tax=Termititenax aidoneus TaxID=2218524 RepID=A0A388TA35_TERA1|nr:23S rRNA pseudouridine synthase F [Candidatus Termititenax aidoneus]
MELIRIQRYLSEQGLASRREAAAWITAGYVSLNGQKVTDTGAKMVLGVDTLKIDKPARYAPKYYFLFNKPLGIVTVNAQKGEREIKDLVKLPKGVVPVGRLDKDTGGLIFLTNDGVVARRIMDPVFYHEKEYEVTLYKPISDKALLNLEQGVYILGQKTRPAKTKRLGGYKFLLTITEGKNRQVRRMCEAVGCPVRLLLRKRILNFHLGELKPGQLKELSNNEKTVLFKTLDIDR